MSPSTKTRPCLRCARQAAFRARGARHIATRGASLSPKLAAITRMRSTRLLISAGDGQHFRRGWKRAHKLWLSPMAHARRQRPCPRPRQTAATPRHACRYLLTLRRHGPRPESPSRRRAGCVRAGGWCLARPRRAPVSAARHLAHCDAGTTTGDEMPSPICSTAPSSTAAGRCCM